MELSTREDGRVTIMSVKGDLVIGEGEAMFKKTVTRLLEEGRVYLLVDLSEVGFLDSSGLGALVRAMTNSQKEGGQTKLLNVGATGAAPAGDDQARLGFRDPRGSGEGSFELLALPKHDGRGHRRALPQ